MIELISSKNRKIVTKAGDVLLKLKSPWFSTDSIEGDMSFPFAAPMTDELSAWLKHPERISGQNTFTSEMVKLLRNGSQIAECKLELGDVDDDIANMTLLSGSSPFAQLIKGLHLDELNLGTAVFNSEADLIANLNSTINGNNTNSPWHLPTVYAPNLIDEEDDNYNYYVRNDFLNASSGGSFALTLNLKKYWLSPMLYYHWLLPEIFKSLGFDIEDNVFNTDEELKEKVFVNLHNITDQEDPLSTRYADLLPHYKLSTFLIDLQNELGIAFDFDRHQPKVSIHWKTKPLQNYHKAKKFPHGKVKVKQKSKFKAIENVFSAYSNENSSILPAIISEKDLLNPEENYLKYTYVISSRKSYAASLVNGAYKWVECDIRWPAAIIPDLIHQVNTFAELPQPELEDVDKYAWVISEEMLYKAYYDAGLEQYIWGESAETMVNTAVSTFKFGAGETTKLESNISVVEEEIANVLMRTDHHYLDAKSMKPLFLFAKYGYVAATSFPGVGIVPALQKTANYNLFWTQNDNFLQNKKVAFWLFLLNAKPVEALFLISDTDLAAWDWTIPLEIENSLAIVDEMDVPISSESKLLEVKITAFTM